MHVSVHIGLVMKRKGPVSERIKYNFKGHKLYNSVTSFKQLIVQKEMVFLYPKKTFKLVTLVKMPKLHPSPNIYKTPIKISFKKKGDKYHVQMGSGSNVI
jgi:hypothetical protein